MDLPLQGRKILVTRPRGQASPLAGLLQEQGAHAILIPTIELLPPQSWCALDAALSCIRGFDWLIFSSANAVDAYAGRAQMLGIAPQAKRIAAIGPATAKAVRIARLADTVDLMPPQYIAESFAEALIPHADGARMLLVRAADARDVLPEALISAGALLTVAEAYRNVVPQSSVDALVALFGDRPPDAITFTSASTAQNLATLLKSGGVALPTGVTLASIGPVTSAAMRSLDMSPDVEAEQATISALVEALATQFRKLVP